MGFKPEPIMKNTFYRIFTTAVISITSLLIPAKATALSYVYSIDECEVTIGADWLYWYVSESGLVAGTFIDDFPDPVLKIAEAESVFPLFSFENGARINTSFSYPKSCWEYDISLTYIPFDASSKFYTTIPGTPTHLQYLLGNVAAFPSFNAFASNGLPAMNTLFANWSGDFYYLDIETAYSFTFFEIFNFRPHMGLRIASMVQTYDLGGEFRFPGVNDSTSGIIRFNQTFEGYGVEGGCWADWKMGCGWSLLGHIGGSFLYGNFTMDHTINSYIDVSTLVFKIHSTAEFHDPVPSLEYFLGLNYASATRWTTFDLHIGWEQKIFFNMNKLATTSGDFTTQGLTLGATVKF